MLKKILLSLLFTTSTFAHSFLPNKIQLEFNYVLVPSMSEVEYLDTLDNFTKFASEKFSVPFTIDSQWDVDWINALAYVTEEGAHIAMFGGMARAPYMNRDGLELILCHELGHHLGGPPYKIKSTWASAEGQADYFATKSCLKELWKEDSKKISIRSIVASQNVVKMIAEVSGDILPDIQKPDLLRVKETELDYPSLQCRLDTFVAGTFDSSRPGCWFFE
jgi:hypothetical protein